MFEGLLSSQAASLYVSLLSTGPIELAAVYGSACEELISLGFAAANRNAGWIAAVDPAVVRLYVRDVVGNASVQKQATLAAGYAMLDSLVSTSATSIFFDGAVGSCRVLTEIKAIGAIQRVFYQAVSATLREWSTGPYHAVHDRGESLVELLALPQPDVIGRGAEHRIVYDADYLTLSGARESIEKSIEAGETVRISARLPMKLALLDERAALVPLEPYGRVAVLIRDGSLVRLLVRFFDLVWHDAQPYVAVQRDPSSMRSQRPLLVLMAAGLKDEAIARQLGVSVRTVRRQIGSLCKELGVSNRFAAGVAAWKAGLLDAG